MSAVSGVGPVSIPIGFSNPLQLRSLPTLTSFWGFQSLLGFLIRCNSAAETVRSSDRAFQSLLGFLIRCNESRPRANRNLYSYCFNPYWVF